MARGATDVHRAREQMHNNIAAAEDGDSYYNVQKSFFQASSRRRPSSCLTTRRWLCVLGFNRALVGLAPLVTAPKCFKPAVVRISRSQILECAFVVLAASIRMKSCFKAEPIRCFVDIEVAALTRIMLLFSIPQTGLPLITRRVD